MRKVGGGYCRLPQTIPLIPGTPAAPESSLSSKCLEHQAGPLAPTSCLQGKRAGLRL